MKAADLSVIMPNYNHAHHLPRSLDAVLHQSVRPRELIVVDDASTDDSVAVAERFARRHSLIRLVRNERNRGVNDTIRRGVGLASGRYLFCWAADDFVLPGFFQKAMGLLALHPEAGMACAYSAPIDGLTGKVLSYPSGRGEQGGFLAPRQVADRIGDGWFPSRATIYKRASFEQAGGYLSDLRWLADWFMALVIAFRDGICHVPECLAHWTAMPTTYSAVGMRDPAANRAVLAAMLARLTSADFADVVPLFRDTGVLAAWGPDVVRAAAAARPDGQEAAVLGLVSGLSRPQYEALARDDDPEVRGLAAIFLGPLWRLGEDRRERLEARLAETNEVVAWMKTSKFWKVRNACLRIKQTLGAWTGRRAAG